MGRCFVIQPFDGGKFDKRYEDVFVPAIQAVGLEPYRVDRDPSVSIPIEDIETGIEGADACLADISTDNPNVWFELGYAIARQREVILICSDERKSQFPFDVQHRSIIRYSPESPRDFDELQASIESRIKSTLQRREKLGAVAGIQSVAKLEGLDQHAVATLVSVAEEIDELTDGLSGYRVKIAMERAGFTKVAATLGLAALVDKGMLECFKESDYDGSQFLSYRVTDPGMAWLLANQDKLTLKREDGPPAPQKDVPF